MNLLWDPPRPRVLDQRLARVVAGRAARLMTDHRRATGAWPPCAVVRWSAVGSAHVLGVEPRA